MIWLLNRYTLGAAFIAALAFGAYLITVHYESKGYARAVAEYSAKQLEAEQQARKVEQDYATSLKKAQDENAKLRIKNRSDAAVAAKSVGSLRDTLSALADSLPTLTAAACHAIAATHGAILAECSGALQKVAGDADQCFTDQRLILESWPK